MAANPQPFRVVDDEYRPNPNSLDPDKFTAWNYCHALGKSGKAGVIGAKAYMVLQSIAAYADAETRSCTPSLRTLAKAVGVNPAIVARGIATLEQCHAVHVTRRHVAGRKEAEVNIYTVLPIDGIIAPPHAKATSERMRQLRSLRAAKSNDSVNTSDTSTPVYDTVNTPVDDSVNTGVDAYRTTGVDGSVNVSVPVEASHSKHPNGSFPGEGAAAPMGVDKPRRPASASPSSSSPKHTPEQIAAANTFLTEFRELIHDIAQKDIAGYMKQIYQGIDDVGADDMLGCLRYKATDERVQGNDRLRPCHIHSDTPAWVQKGRPVRYQAGGADKPLNWVGAGPTHKELAARNARSTKCPECEWTNGHHAPECARRSGA